MSISETVEHFTLNVASEKEKEANEFASELLIPNQILQFIISDKKITQIESLANIFNVSQSLIAIKLKQLNII